MPDPPRKGAQGIVFCNWQAVYGIWYEDNLIRQRSVKRRYARSAMEQIRDKEAQAYSYSCSSAYSQIGNEDVTKVNGWY